MGASSKCCFLPAKCWAAFGVLLAIGFLTMAFVVPRAIDDALEKGLNDALIITGKDHDGFAKFQDNTEGDSPALWKKYWLFNVTNAKEVEEQGAKPILVEKGPYVYRSVRIKHDVKFRRFPDPGSKAALIEFTDYTYYLFNEKKSCADCDPDMDVFTLPSPGFWTLQRGVQGDETLEGVLKMLLAGYAGHKAFITETVHNLLWGYKDPLMAYLKEVLPIELPLPLELSFQTNHTSPEHAFEDSCRDALNNGHADLEKLRMFEQWHCMTHVEDLWVTPEKVWGTDAAQTRWDLHCDCGTRVPPYQRMLDADGNITAKYGFDADTQLPYEDWPCQGDVLPIWVDTIHRTLPMQCFNSDVDIKGISTYKFQGALSLLKNDTLNPVNKNYHQLGVSGLLNMTQKAPNVPIFLSKAHFLDADPAIVDLVEGVSPARPHHHDIWLLVEPITGATMQAFKRLQINMEIIPNALLSNISMSYCPAMWVEETSEITDKLAKDFKDKIYTPLKLRGIIKYVGISLASLMVAVILAVWYVRHRRAKAQQPADFDYYEYTTLYDGAFDDSINN